MVTRILISILVAAITASAEIVLVDNSAISNGVYSGGGGAGLTRVDLGDFTSYLRWQETHLTPVGYPSLYQTESKVCAEITSTVNEARTRLELADRQTRPAHYALKDWLGTNDAQTLRVSIRATKANFRTNATFTATLRRDFARAIETEAKWAELREAKAEEKQRLGIKDDEP